MKTQPLVITITADTTAFDEAIRGINSALALARASTLFIFELQRSNVTMLNSEPWYRHLRLRWQLRNARKWAK